MVDTKFSSDIAQRLDQIEIVQLIQAWTFLRDAGEWDGLANTFHPDGRIAVSWFQGSFPEFVATSRARWGSSFAKHVMAGSRVTLQGDRAIAESDLQLFTRGVVDGVEYVGQTLSRFLDRIERRADAVWRILDRVAVYDHDTLLPAVPGTQVSIPMAELEGLNPAYRFLAWRLRRAGLPVPDMLPTLGSTIEQELLKANRDWLLAI